MTQKQLAARLGVSEKTIQNWEAERYAPSPGDAARLGEILGIDLAPPDTVTHLIANASDLELITALLMRLSMLRAAATVSTTTGRTDQDAILAGMIMEAEKLRRARNRK